MKRILIGALWLIILSVGAGAKHNSRTALPTDAFSVRYDPLHLSQYSIDPFHRDSVETDTVDVGRYTTLTDSDYIDVARELGVETAAIRAVVDIETGGSHEGFFEPGKPIVNFDLAIFRRFATKRKINLAKYANSHAAVFAAPNVRRYGSRHAAQWARLEMAMKIDSAAAIEGAFWGMFQIGGFNWKQCGASSMSVFVKRMCYSEREQLELFAAFLRTLNLVRYLKTHNWDAFARGYNGASYKRHNYDQRLARAYAKYKNQKK